MTARVTLPRSRRRTLMLIGVAMLVMTGCASSGDKSNQTLPSVDPPSRSDSGKSPVKPDTRPDKHSEIERTKGGLEVDLNLVKGAIPSPKQFTARTGDQVHITLWLKHEPAGSVTLQGYRLEGAEHDVSWDWDSPDRDTASSFEFIAAKPGTYPLVTNRKQLLGTLVITK